MNPDGAVIRQVALGDFVALGDIVAFRDCIGEVMRERRWLAFVEPYDEAHMMAIHYSGMR